MENDIPVVLTDAHVGLFHEQGFLSLGRITTDAEVAWLREAYQAIVKRRTGFLPWAVNDARAQQAHKALVTLTMPEHTLPELKDTLYARNARKVVARLFDIAETDVIVGWRLFTKPAHGGETTWHQDVAYRPHQQHQGATVWMPLDPVTVENGCLLFIAGSHRGAVHPHTVHQGQLRAEHIDPASAVACPLAPGEATVHHCGTLHAAGPNHTDAPRRAFSIVFQVTGSGHRNQVGFADAAAGIRGKP